ncbi:MAG: SDR family NAD(P)-dependent oxidoreductase [Negativicutes bacterium]
MKLSGKVVVITGAARGIGKAIALGMAEEGAVVKLIDIDLKEAEKVAAEINANGGNAQAFEMDVSQKNRIHEVVIKILQQDGHIDVWINNAGIAGVAKFMETSEEEWDQIMNINLKSVYYCCQAVIPSMVANGAGKIINIASIAAKIGGGLLGSTTYAASKAGMIGLSKGLAREFSGSGINVNVIAPGSITTDITRRYMTEQQQVDSIKRIPVGRRGMPEDLVGAAILLASHESDFITGATIDVNGGILMD